MDALSNSPFTSMVTPKKFTPREKLTAESERAVKHFLGIVLKDRLLLLSIVTGGKFHWKTVAGKAFKGFLVSDAMLDQMFVWLTAQAGPNPLQQFEDLQRSGLVALKLERLRGLARFITSERHLDEVLDKWIQHPDEKAAIRGQLLLMIRSQGVVH